MRAAGSVVSYLLTFPVRHARVDALWLLGGARLRRLLADGHGADASRWSPSPGLPPPACRSRSTAAGTCRSTSSRLLRRWRWPRAWAGRMALDHAARIVNARVAVADPRGVAVWRVNDFPKLVENTLARRAVRARAGSTRHDHLARYGDRTTRKYSALAVDELGALPDAARRPGRRVYVFGFSARCLRRRRPGQRLALLLEPAGDRRFQRRPARVRRQRAPRRSPAQRPASSRCSSRTGLPTWTTRRTSSCATRRWPAGCARTTSDRRSGGLRRLARRTGAS